MTRYTSEINKKRLNLYYHTLLDLYKSIRTSTRFRFEVDLLDDQVGPYSIVLTAKYFDFFDYADEKIYRYYILTNEKRRDLVEHIELFDKKLRQIPDKDCSEHLEKQGYRQREIYLDEDITIKELRELEMLMTAEVKDEPILQYDDNAKSNGNSKCGLDEIGSTYHLNGIDYKVLGTRNGSEPVRDFLVMSEKKEVTASEMRTLIKSVRFRGTELIQKIPKEKRAEDEDSLMYKYVMETFRDAPFWDTTILVDLNYLTNDEILIYLGINNHTLLDVQNINVITEKNGDAFLRFH